MLKKTKFYIGLSLLVQSVTLLILFIMIFTKKKSLPATLLALAAIGGVSGTCLVLQQVSDVIQTSKVSVAIDDLCDIKDEPLVAPDKSAPFIPVDDTVNEDEFR